MIYSLMEMIHEAINPSFFLFSIKMKALTTIFLSDLDRQKVLTYTLVKLIFIIRKEEFLCGILQPWGSYLLTWHPFP